ncbi:hypothetical protein QO021_28335 (plasmid) [Pseudomonas amygdali pv. lachrymans]|uniref:hypothetical protein n=1 Tax=Pseudomonas amygdali TaxID=47877 RepID=UPI0006B94C7E|nr:hypothetical protein [Pseudomonas amygdali]KPC02326.1 Uncharacterized protein AC501_3612 [Pseudomonas amygdali pv. lachrymans]RMM39407.1 hypothetical protein ALQ79_200708 [Pseudomonas amygdali pv. lachrymans]WIO61467.1 hypothetical protein QO021_28335 [Pseudomonas amygdali pv. lachrymans]
MESIVFRFYMIGYAARLLPRVVRKVLSRTVFHRAWLAGHMGIFEQDGRQHGVADRVGFDYRK